MATGARQAVPVNGNSALVKNLLACMVGVIAITLTVAGMAMSSAAAAKDLTQENKVLIGRLEERLKSIDENVKVLLQRRR